MMKNLILYRLGPAWPQTADQLEAALDAEPFAECGATQQKSTGWVPPRGQEHGALVETVGGQWIARFAIETKSVPGDALRRKTREAIEAVEKTTGRKPGKKESRDLRDDALLALLPPTRDDVEKAYRRLAAVRHPDKGGSDAAMAELNRARDEALEAIK